MTIQRAVVFVASMLIASIVLSAGALAGSVTIGVADTGNCYPFMCNDSGTNSGISIWYEQVYSSTAFSGPVTITSATFYWQFAQQFGGSDTLLGGGYEFDLSTTSAPVNGLNGGCLSCNLGADNKIVGDFIIPTGGISFGTSFTFTLVNAFTYDPSKGNLLLSIAVNNQDNVPNGSGNSYNGADDTGTVTSRAYSFLNSNSRTADGRSCDYFWVCYSGTANAVAYRNSNCRSGYDTSPEAGEAEAVTDRTGLGAPSKPVLCRVP
jgi:hypothetical protein